MDVKKVTENLISWIREWFKFNGPDCNAIIGISGGKDSTIVAALCVQALGKDRVIGIMMPNGEQKDINDSIRVCEYLGIKNYTINIQEAIAALGKQFFFPVSNQTAVNLPPRIRMATLYAIGQSHNGRVANTCNRSENFVGYETKFGDAAGDFAPLANLTVREVLAIGDCLGLPHDLVHKTPMDGLNLNPDGSYVTDEQNLGITYDQIDDYLLYGKGPDEPAFSRMMDLHYKAMAKNRMLAFGSII